MPAGVTTGGLAAGAGARVAATGFGAVVGCGLGVGPAWDGRAVGDAFARELRDESGVAVCTCRDVGLLEADESADEFAGSEEPEACNRRIATMAMGHFKAVCRSDRWRSVAIGKGPA